jgi:hypothetical protein
MHWRWCRGLKYVFTNKKIFLGENDQPDAFYQEYMVFMYSWFYPTLIMQEYDSKCLKMYLITLTHSLPDLSRQHHLHTISQNLKCGWENIWRKVIHIINVNNVSSNNFQIILSVLADVTAKIPKWRRWGWMSWGLMVTSVTKGGTQKLPKEIKIVKTYLHDHSLESSWGWHR